MTASSLARLIPGAALRGPDRTLHCLAADSQRIRQGDAFIALKGSVADGHAYIPDALRRGASILICNAGHGMERVDATVLAVPDTRAALPVILNAMFPKAREVDMAGITGTNGKTTTTYLAESILAKAGVSCGVIGTINTRYAGIQTASSLTTPGPVDLFELLHAMRANGARACIMEVSSHALDQDRVAGLTFRYGLFTNLSQDHLDYHRDMETYFQAKRRLYTHYLSGKAILNTDDVYGMRLFREIPDALTYGLGPGAAIHPVRTDNAPSGLTMRIATPSGEIELASRLKGMMNAYNILAAVGLGQAMGVDNDHIRAGIEALAGVPGRMESVDNAHGLTIIVDYAHTPDALDTVLKNARGFTRGRILAVFGCGGDRDRTKRPIMGAIAAAGADIPVVTSDNPRTEDPLAIIDEILQGIPERGHVLVEPDRSLAICRAIRLMGPDDCLIIAGKGHEDYQIIGTTRVPFDDRVCVRECLKEVYGQ